MKETVALFGMAALAVSLTSIQVRANPALPESVAHEEVHHAHQPSEAVVAFFANELEKFSSNDKFSSNIEQARVPFAKAPTHFSQSRGAFTRFSDRQASLLPTDVQAIFNKFKPA